MHLLCVISREGQHLCEARTMYSNLYCSADKLCVTAAEWQRAVPE